jgi:hypothetical protein
MAAKDNGPPTPDTNDPLALAVDGVRYDLDRPPSKGGRKVIMSVALASGERGTSVVDRVDLYSHRQRLGLATLVSDTFGKDRDKVLGHLALLLDQVERAAGDDKKPDTVVLTVARRTAAEKILRSKNVLAVFAAAITALGLVGEERNAKLGLLVVVSRLLEKTLSAIFRAPPASGKSEVIEKLVAVTPEEAVESLSRLTSASLYYLGSDYLRHKLVVVEEAVGAAAAEHPVRLLQSAGQITLATVVKNRTEKFTVHGPISLVAGTTASRGNVENSSRCLELTLDESPEQTKAIHEAQRRFWSGEQTERLDTTVFKDAQRLMEATRVTIPFATKLAFPARDTTDRREQPKMLGLVAAHALLNQRHRETDSMGRLVATLDDYRAVFDLYAPLVEAEFEDLSTRAAALYRALTKTKSTGAISRRDAAGLMSWSYTTTRRALDELLAHELLKLADNESPKRYRVLDVPAAEASGLTPPDELNG